MIVMEHQEEIPCASCQSWNGKEKKFSCNPNRCKGLSEWMHEHSSKTGGMEQILLQRPDTAIQYIV
jgi:hypothetical protein